jgi:hypothetical protein
MKHILPAIAVLFAMALGASLSLVTAQNQIPRHGELRNLPADIVRAPVLFSGGHETDPRDRGRPVVLIAAALGVPPEVFREAFNNVHPADPNVGPTGDEARKNKAALLVALGKYGITNERLDAVSDYYRYVRARNELWRAKPAVANALIKNGAIIGYELLDGGSGYSSTPKMSVPSIKAAAAQIKLTFGKSFESNGTISAITIPAQNK